MSLLLSQGELLNDNLSTHAKQMSREHELFLVMCAFGDDWLLGRLA